MTKLPTNIKGKFLEIVTGYWICFSLKFGFLYDMMFHYFLNNFNELKRNSLNKIFFANKP